MKGNKEAEGREEVGRKSEGKISVGPARLQDIIKINFKETVLGGFRLDLAGSGFCSMTNTFEDGNEHSDSRLC
jgi:hypothetical protein